MKKTILLLCALLALSLATGLQAQDRERPGAERRPRTERPRQRPSAGETKVRPRQNETADKAEEAKEQAPQKNQAQSQQQTASSKEKKAEDSAATTKQGAEELAKGKGKDHQQQLRAFEQQRQRNEAKHMERQARLARIRELAVQKGDADMIARVDKLIAKEQQVHQRKVNRLQQQRRATTGSDSAPTVPPKGKGGAKDGPKEAKPEKDAEQEVKNDESN